MEVMEFGNFSDENWTTVIEYSEEEEIIEDGVLTYRIVFGIDDIINNIVLGLTLSALLYGLISWRIFKKFRNYRNYVFLNSIFANFMLYTMTKIIFNHGEFIYAEFSKWAYRVILNLYLYFVCVKNHWLLVISHMFYVEFVKVFNGDIRRKYLKSNLFAWGVALINVCVLSSLYFCCLPRNEEVYLSDNDGPPALISHISQILPLIVNFCFYIIIVFSLCRSFNTGAHTAANIRRRLYIATLIFILSDVLLLSNYVLGLIYFNTIIEKNSQTRILIEVILNHLNAFLLPIFLFVVKSNRENWYEFYLKKYSSGNPANTLKA